MYCVRCSNALIFFRVRIIVIRKKIENDWTNFFRYISFGGERCELLFTRIRERKVGLDHRKVEVQLMSSETFNFKR